MRLALNDAANVIVDDAKPRVPARSGRARASVKARSTQSQSRVVGGGNKAPYYPWLDFGGRVGRGRTGPNTGSVHRTFIRNGRYIYNAYFRNRGEYATILEASLVKIARDAGVEIT
jgi:hypothetical protein